MSGRPSEYTPETEVRICEEITSGKSLREICRADGMPSRDTVYNWMAVNQAFADRYARAVEDRAELLASEIVSIADDSANDYGFKEGEDKDGAGAKPVFLAENVQRSKLRVDARKWVASKLFPRKYGEKVQNEVTGEGGKPIEFAVKVTLVRPNGPASA